MTTPNIFRALSRYASSQSENYLTESFVHVLRVLKARARPQLHEVVRKLSGLDSVGELIPDAPIRITTQSSLPEGRPDIEFALGNKLRVFVEVKDWARVGPGQLEGYYDQI